MKPSSKGTSDNSPAIHRRVMVRKRNQSRQGRQNMFVVCLAVDDDSANLKGQNDTRRNQTHTGYERRRQNETTNNRPATAGERGTFRSVNVPAGISVNYSNNGVYLVVVGAVPVQILAPQLAGTNFVFQFPTASGQSYTVQRNRSAE